MSNNTDISVLTPLYNHNIKYVRQCLNSLKEQDYQNIEFLLIDNGANTENEEIIDEYVKKDSRFKVIYFKENVGMGAALNKGIQEAKGKYIGFLESDDFIEGQMYKDLYEIAQKYNCDIVKSTYLSFYDKTETNLENNFKDEFTNRLIEGRGTCYNLIDKHVSHWSGIYKKEFLTNNNIKFNETPGGASQDFGFILRCYAYADKVYITSKPYIHYRVDSGNHEATFLNNNIVRECKLTFDILLNDKNIPLEVWERIYKRVALRILPAKDLNKQNKEYRYYIFKTFDKLIKYKYFDKEQKEKIKEFIKPENSFAERIFSVKNSKDKFHKIVIILGFKLKFKRKKYLKQLALEEQLKEIRILLKKNAKEIKNLSKTVSTQITRMAGLKTIVEAQYLHKDTFLKYKNAFSGRDVVLVCTGPTAKYYKPIENAIHVGVNGAVYLDYINLDYLFIQDYTIHQDNNKSLTKDCIDYKNDTCKKFVGIIADNRLENVKENIERIPLQYTYSQNISRYILDDQLRYNVTYDLSYQPMGDFGGTSFSALQFILYTHPKRIFLVGWDCGAGYAYNRDNALGFANRQITVLQDHIVPFINIHYPDIEIVTLNPVGLKGMFSDVYTQNYIDEENPEFLEENPKILEEKIPV